MVYTVARGVDNNWLMQFEKWLLAVPVVLAALAMSAIITLRPGEPNTPDTGGGQDTAQSGTAPTVNIRNTSERSNADRSNNSGSSTTGESTATNTIAGRPHQTADTSNTPSITRQTLSAAPTESGGNPDQTAATDTTSSTGDTAISPETTSTKDSTASLPLTLCLGSKDATSSGSLLDIGSDYVCVN